MSDHEYNRELARAKQLVELEQDDRAMEILTRLLAHHPEHEGCTRKVLALAHMRADRTDEAVASARAAVRLLPQDPVAHRILGQTLACQGDEAAAEHSLRACLALDPRNADAHFLMAGMWASTPARHEEALAHAREAVRLDPNEPMYHLILGHALEDRDPAGAEAALREALRLDPACGQARFRLALVRSGRGDHDGAAHDIAAFAAQNPGSRTTRMAVDLFITRCILVVLVTTALCLVLALAALGLVRLAGLPATIAVLVLVLATAPVVISACRRVRAQLDAFPNGGWQIVGSFLRRRRLIALSLALLAASWAGLAIGAVLLVMGSGAALGWAAAGGLIAVVIGWLLIYASFTAGRR